MIPQAQGHVCQISMAYVKYNLETIHTKTLKQLDRHRAETFLFKISNFFF